MIKLGLRETNSSSAHALLSGLPPFEEMKYPKLTKDMKVTDLEAGEVEFGWQIETYTDRESIINYILIQARENLRDDDKEILLHKISDIVDYKSAKGVIYSRESMAYIDHQSKWSIDGEDAHKIDFFLWLIRHAVAGNIGLATGNDNEENKIVEKITYMQPMSWLFSHFDDYYSLYLVVPRSGRLIVSFIGFPYKLIVEDDYSKDLFKVDGEYPDLVDSLITLKCDNQCPYCYIGASPDGKTANIDEIIKFLNKASGRVTEIAIGGGDVTKINPYYLSRILGVALNKNILPSITLSMDPSTLESSIKFMENIEEYLSEKIDNFVYRSSIKVGITIICEKDYMNFLEILDNIRLMVFDIGFVMHVINGITHRNVIKRMIVDGQNILFLGYKSTENNKNFKPVKSRFWTKDEIMDLFKMTKDVPHHVILFDDLALQQTGITKDVVGDDIWESFYLGDDGVRSGYIDFVRHLAGPNSYEYNKMGHWDCLGEAVRLTLSR